MENGTKKNIKFSEKTLQLVNRIMKRYPEGKQKSAIIPVLHLAQEELGNGWLSAEVMDYVATILSIQPIEVYEVASFYSMFHTKPTGKYVLEVCRTSPCCHQGAEELIHYLEKKLQIKAGETTSDKMFTIKPVECLASCGTAPMMQVGTHYYENLNETKVDELLEKFRNLSQPETQWVR